MMGVSIPSYIVLEGAILGLNYGLLAVGLTLIYRTSRVVNFAQGQLGVVAAVFLVKLFYDFGINYWVALVAALALAAAAGAGSELLLRRLFDRPRVMVMVATIGLSQVLYLLTVLPFIRPKQLFRAFPVPIHWTFQIGSFPFTPGDVLTLIVAPIVAVALALFIRFSPWGLAMRASAENTDSARLSGVWVRRTSTVAWTIAGVLSAITAVLASPSQTSALTEVLSPDLLLLALLAALIGGMVSLPVAFAAGIGVGIVQDLLQWNFNNPSTGTATVELWLFILLQLALIVRAASLQKGARTFERASWKFGTTSFRLHADRLRRRVGAVGVGTVVLIAALLPLVLDVDRNFLMSQICIYGVIALSLTILVGWSGQVSLGQFGLVAVGADIASHLAGGVNLVLLLPLAGAITAVVSVLVGLTALRIRGLYLAVSTLGFALFVQTSVLPTTCWTMPFVHRTLCTGLPDPESTLISRPSLFGLSLTSDRAFAWFSLGVLVLSVLMVRGMAGQRHRPPPHLGARQRDRRRRGGHPGGAHEAPRLCAVGLHRRLCRGLFRPRYRALLGRHLRPAVLDPGGVDGRHRWARLHRRRRARCALPRGPSRHLRVGHVHPIPHQRHRPVGLHPLSPGRHGGRHAPTR